MSLWLFLMILPGGADRDTPKATSKTKVVEVTISCSTYRIDPLDPGDHYLKCTVRNVSDRTIEVPTFYSGGYEQDLSLHAWERWDLTLVRWAGEKKAERRKLAPGEEWVVFQDKLRHLLLLNVKQPKDLVLKPGQDRYYWSWSA